VEGYVSEQERVEAIKKWWKENGTAVIVGIVLGLAILFGGRAWIEHRETQAEQASLAYSELLQAMEARDTAAALARAERILQDYSGTGYAALAALASARLHQEQGDAAGARSNLQWVLDNSRRAELRNVARLRLGRLLIAAGEVREALALAQGAADPGFEAAYEELQGDAYVALGEIDQARAAYRRALALLEPAGRSRALVQMKLEDLGPGAEGEQVS
jgi:predicted negative regulator of RcsB-dependent stress response